MSRKSEASQPEKQQTIDLVLNNVESKEGLMPRLSSKLHKHTNACAYTHTHELAHMCTLHVHASYTPIKIKQLIKRPKQDKTLAGQTPNPAALFPESGAHDRIIWAPKSLLSCIPPALPSGVHSLSFELTLLIHAAFPTGHPIILPSPGTSIATYALPSDFTQWLSMATLQEIQL